MSFLLGIKNKFMIIISGLVSVVMGIMYFIILKKDNNIKDLEKDNIIKDVEVQVKDNNIESLEKKIEADNRVREFEDEIDNIIIEENINNEVNENVIDNIKEGGVVKFKI